MPRISEQEEKQRLELYNQGLVDREIAERLGMTKSGISNWRESRRLPANRKRRERTGQREYMLTHLRGVPMEEALDPRQCEVVRIFLRALVTAANRAKGKRYEVGAFMKAWREMYGRREAG